MTIDLQFVLYQLLINVKLKYTHTHTHRVSMQGSGTSNEFNCNILNTHEIVHSIMTFIMPTFVVTLTSFIINKLVELNFTKLTQINDHFLLKAFN